MEVPGFCVIQRLCSPRPDAFWPGAAAGADTGSSSSSAISTGGSGTAGAAPDMMMMLVAVGVTAVVVAAGAVVPDHSVLAPLSIVAGTPCRLLGEVSPAQADERRRLAELGAARRRAAG